MIHITVLLACHCWDAKYWDMTLNFASWIDWSPPWLRLCYMDITVMRLMPEENRERLLRSSLGLSDMPDCFIWARWRCVQSLRSGRMKAIVSMVSCSGRVALCFLFDDSRGNVGRHMIGSACWFQAPCRWDCTAWPHRCGWAARLPAHERD